MQGLFYSEIIASIKNGQKLLAVLIDPEKFSVANTFRFLSTLPE